MPPASTSTPRRYGTTDLLFHPLGLGAAQLGNPSLPDANVANLLDVALDAGIQLLDTAPSYGLSEERLGRLLGARRVNVVLSTKLGYGVQGVPDWTGACITSGIERALRVLRTDHIDIAHLHSCPRATLEHTDIIDALESGKRAGKLRAIAYSGENDDLAWAVASGRFDGFMASLNLCDQRIIASQLPALNGKGFIAKRALANQPWRFAQQPVGDYCEPYWLRWKAMNLDPQGLDWGALSLRLALHTNGVNAAIVGTANPKHLLQALQWAAQGPLPTDQQAQVLAAFARHDQGWTGQI